jgi:hypothetical protein
MKQVGKVSQIALGIQNIATALVRQKVGEPAIVLGQFVLFGDGHSDRYILGRVIEIQPDVSEVTKNYKEALRDALKEEHEVDRFYHDELSFLSYKCKLLGICQIGKAGDAEFYSDVRQFPAIEKLGVYVPTQKVMQSIVRGAIKPRGDEKVVEFHIGDLAYGSDPLNTSEYSGENAVAIYFNVLNILRKRTAIFGKSGYGKSNQTKGIVGMLACAAPNVGQLLIDTNGEYSLDNAQNDGFLNIFHEAGMENKVEVYTNRNLSEAVKTKYAKSVRPLRIDAYAEPSTVFAIVAESVRKQIRNDELPKYLVKWVNGSETEDNKSAWDSVGKKNGVVWAMYYAALATEGIRPASDKQKCEIGTYMDQEFIATLIPNVGGELESDPSNEDKIAKEDWATLKDEFFIIERQSRFYTNHIATMATYGRWFAENKAADDSDLKDFKDLVNDKSYRLSSIKKIHIGNAGGATQGLSTSVFRSLKEGKIVILDLATEGIRVSDVLTRHILNHVFTRMSDDFGRTEIRKEFAKRDIVVYIEESQNYLSDKNIGEGSIYERIVKEGRKFNIGTVYITQQPSAISPSITSQTENIFALHMSNDKDTQVLNAIKDKYDELTCRFLKDEAVQGLCYCFSEPYQPFVLPVRIKLFSKDLITSKK